MAYVVCSLFTTRTIISWVYCYAKRANFVFNFVCQVSKLSEKERKKQHIHGLKILFKNHIQFAVCIPLRDDSLGKNCFYFSYLCNSGYISCRLTSKFVGVANFRQSVDDCIQKQATLLAKYVRFSFVNDNFFFAQSKQLASYMYALHWNKIKSKHNPKRDQCIKSIL